jgi:spore germination cell wall hydrolase CwlJ-like protein
MSNNRRLSIGVSVLVISAVLNGIHDNKQDERISDLEKKGEVTVTLGDPDFDLKPIETVKTENKLPSLYNNHTRIIFHSKKEFQCIAENIYYEAGVEGFIGKISVAQTVFNRAETGKWGNSFCDVIHSKKQYSWTNTKQKPPKGPLWEASKDAAKAFQYGIRVRNLENVKHYHTTAVNTVWDNDMNKVGTIGNHVFYASR